jgi:ribosomal protein RSM22 (predicted rRNA methylase)
MSSEISEKLKSAISDWLARNPSPDRREASARLSKSYAAGETSGHVDLGAYLTVRMPATYAAISKVLSEVAPHITPTSMLDMGAGPGTASFVAAELWPSLARFDLIETDHRFAALARELCEAALPAAKISKARMQDVNGSAELVVAGYVFAEMSLPEVKQAALWLWQNTAQVLVIIEPGTPQGFARVKTAREALLKAGGFVVGPCTHANACPIAKGDWCHFKTRLSRSREHLHSKGAHVPFEDESFSWIAISRVAYPLATARIIAPPLASKVGVTLKTCSSAGIATNMIASRDKPAYKRAKKLAWGDAIVESENAQPR